MKRIRKQLTILFITFVIMGSLILGMNFYFGYKITNDFYEEYPDYLAAEEYVQIDIIREYVYEHVAWEGNKKANTNQYTSPFRNVLRRLGLGNYTIYQELSNRGGILWRHSSNSL